jgi:hypothetical protein
MLAAGPVSFGGLFAVAHLAPAISSSIDVCNDSGQVLCTSNDAVAAALVTVLAIAGLVFSLVWVVWQLGAPLMVFGLVALAVVDRRAVRRLLLGGALPPAAPVLDTGGVW